MAKKRRKAAKRKSKSSASRRARPKASRKKTKIRAKRASRRKAAVKKSRPKSKLRAKVTRAKVVSPKAVPSVVERRPHAKREELPEDITLSEDVGMGEDVREEVALDDEEDEADFLEKSEDVQDDNEEFPRS